MPSSMTSLGRRFAFAAPAVLVLSVAPRPASAQETLIDVERMKPAVTYDGFVNMEGSAVRDAWDRWQFGLWLNYAYNPLVMVSQDGSLTRRYVGGRLGFDVFASATIVGPFALGLGVPFFLAQTGDLDPSFAGLGDIRLVPKLRILDDRDSIGLGVVAELRVPSHVGDFAGGARMVVFAPRAVLDHRFDMGLRFGVNAGVLIRKGTSFINIDAASEFTYAAGLAYRFGGNDGKFELGLEANGGVGLAATDIEELPLETNVFARFMPTPEWQITAGPALGLVPGYGIPTFRVFAGVSFSPTSKDADHDGIPDDEDRCPQEPEDRDGDQDTDGCPEEDKDDDKDGVPNATDRCPNEKETINGITDEDGCPDQGKGQVIYEGGKLQMLDNVQFQTGSARIDPKSYALLDQVALVLKANPDIKEVRVEGHTDETGSREGNIILSKSRAQSVRSYLIQKGVSPARLKAEGYGPDRPLVKGSDPQSRAKNRRVEFVMGD